MLFGYICEHIKMNNKKEYVFIIALRFFFHYHMIDKSQLLSLQICTNENLLLWLLVNQIKKHDLIKTHKDNQIKAIWR